MRRPREPGGGRLVAAALLLALMAAALAACGPRQPTVVEIVVPLGTQERLARGETVVVMPDELQFHVGDTLRIRNEDLVDQSVGPYRVKAGETLDISYGSPGRYQGMCPLSEGETYDILVLE